jgi:sugar phosphate isomerase/epimerase
MSESDAKKKAQEIIGVTFDLGHANINKKYGFTDKDIIKEAEALAKNVKHVHLADNFGYNDSHLPPGMGNVATRKFRKIRKRRFQRFKNRRGRDLLIILKSHRLCTV